ncbi:MAG TPA: anti-sigma factor [Ktedonobacterales bacterium]|nr:anti-sigma factor [Ktedonobacterales bacterium]
MSERPNQLTNHVQDQIDAYALGILEDGEVAQVEAHLAECQECQRLLRQARAVTALLALAPRQVQPPARLKQRILARIAQEGQVGGAPGSHAARGGDSVADEQRLAQALDPTFASALPGITPERQGLLEAMRHLFSGRKGLQTPGAAQPDAQHQLQDILRLLRAPHPAVWELPGTAEAPQARARLLGAPDEHMAVLVVSGLEPLPPERDYQLWFLRDGEPTGSAVFDVQHNGEGQILVHAPRQLGHFDLAAITPEPAGGSPGPTGPIIIAGEIKAA